MLDWILTPANIEWLFRVLAIATPVLGVAALAYGRTRSYAAKGRPEYIVPAVSGPMIWALWKVYNAIEDHFGLDSVAALGINAGLFLSIGFGLGLWLRAARVREKGSVKD